MIISGLEWISESGDEAILHVTDNNMNIAVFSHPFNRAVGDKIEEPLHPLEAMGIRLVHDKDPALNRHNDSLGYDCCGVLYDKSSGVIKIGEISLELEEALPGDAIEGDLIEFSCSRIDLW